MGYEFKMSFYISLAYRCPAGNTALYQSLGIPERTRSQHKYGTAADLTPPASESSRWTEDFKREIAMDAINNRGAGYSDYQYESENHVHVDWGPRRTSPWQK